MATVLASSQEEDPHSSIKAALAALAALREQDAYRDAEICDFSEEHGHDEKRVPQPSQHSSRRPSGISHPGLEKAKDVAKTVGAKIFQVTTAVKLAGSVLAMCAGIVNVVAFHALGTFTSHVTGNVSRVAIFAQYWDPVTFDFLGLVLSFMAGSMVCGILIAKNTVNIGLALYGLVLMGNSILLFLATLEAHQHFARFLVAAACGLQNGIATSYSGAVIRTTHLTGISTDMSLIIGRLIGLLIRRRCGARRFDVIDKADIVQDLNKLQVLSILFFSFWFGAFMGTWLYMWLSLDAMLVPAFITGVAGLLYSCWRVVWLNQSLLSDKEMEAVEVTLADTCDVALPAKGAPVQDHQSAEELHPECEAHEPETHHMYLNVLHPRDIILVDRSAVLERQIST